MQKGAFDFLTKPIHVELFLKAIHKALQVQELKSEIGSLKKGMLTQEVEHPEAFKRIVTQSPAMSSIFKYIEAIAKSLEPVLITGESGVGKELIARAIHELSGGPGEFVGIDAAGLDAALSADTLFGHKRGSYTGATDFRLGLMEKAKGGTLFLDEIGNLNLEVQIKLLRVLQEKEYYPIGHDSPSDLEAHIIAATNVDNAHLRDSEKFRHDLYYRLSTHHIHIPPLRERPEDIPLLIEHFAAQAAAKLGKSVPLIVGEVYDLLTQYDFPGNVRELQSLIVDAVSFTENGGELSRGALSNACI